MPPEIEKKLEIYHQLLLKWQKAINLVSPNTVDQARERHFDDSLQLVDHIAENAKTLIDIGSGAGFPGLVLAITCPDIDVHLVESDERKGQFLKTVSRETQLENVTIHTSRIENSYNDISGNDISGPDIVTARALADFKTLLDLSWPWIEQNPELQCLFLKGAKADEEIQEARKFYNFEVECLQSQTDKQGKILKVKKIKKAANS